MSKLLCGQVLSFLGDICPAVASLGHPNCRWLSKQLWPAACEGNGVTVCLFDDTHPSGCDVRIALSLTIQG